MNLFRTPAPAEALAAGFEKFRRERWPTAAPRYNALARRRQSPQTLVIVGADARLDPETLFSAEPGSLFVVSNLGAIVPPYAPDEGLHGTSAAIEFAVRILKVRHVVVLGQSRCEAVRALVDGVARNGRDFVEPWLGLAEPILWPIPPDVPENDLFKYLEQALVRLSLRNLRSYPWLDERIRHGGLVCEGFWFDLVNGELVRVD